MRVRIFRVVAALVLAGLPCGAVTTQTQTDWNGGPGQAGPVASWDYRFYDSTATDYHLIGSLYLARAPQFPGTRHHVADRTELYAAQTGDIDGDGDPDIVVGGHNSGIVWYENLGGGNFGTTPHLILDYVWPSFQVYDLNGDGRADVIYTDDQYIYWYENRLAGWLPHVISPYFDEVDGTGVADFDNDGDPDIVAGGVQTTDLRWYRNDGNQNFTQYVITTNYAGPNNAPLATGDLNGDGRADFVISSEFGNLLDWWENRGGNPPTFTRHTLLTNYNGCRNSFIVDVNGDGRMDILSAAIQSNSIDWWENRGGTPPTFTRHNIASGYGGAYDIVGFDADWDGDVDILTTAQTGDTLDWWQNDGQENWTRGTIASGYNGASSIWVDDVSGDGVEDIVSSALDAGSADWWSITYGYRPSGNLTSAILDTGGAPAWGYISWHGNTPSNTQLRFRVRASNNSGNMGNWSAYITNSGADLHTYLTNGLRYFQYQTDLSSTNNQTTPRLDDVSITYSTNTGIVADFKAEGARDGLALSWRTNPGAGVAGFNLYRAPAGAAEAPRAKLNGALITGGSPYSYRDDAAPGGTYKYWLEVVKLNGGTETCGPAQATAGEVRVESFALGACRPNPVRERAVITFALPRAADCRLEVYDLAGRRLATLAQGRFGEGAHDVTWTPAAASVPAGVYVYTLRADGFAAAKRLVVAR